MLDTADPELCSIITNVCKPPKHFDFPETEKAFRFVWFEEFPWICFSWWEDRNYCLPCVSSGHKDVGKSLKIYISNMATRIKYMQKKSKCSNQNTQRQILFHRIFGECK